MYVILSVLKYHTLSFALLSESLFALIQSDFSVSSELTLIVRLLRSLLLKSRLVSLANSTNCAVCDDNGISFI